ncbi:MAG: hypothetical protein M1812_005653 [Candelaria pacifica]|nr:MAG: hypothetical protein M1812_005653 [Candelaria pacifica]
MILPYLSLLSFLSCITAFVIHPSTDTLHSSSSLTRAPRSLNERQTDPRTRVCTDLYGRPTLADCEAAIAQLPTNDLDTLTLFWRQAIAFNGKKVLLPLKKTSGTCILELTVPVQGYVPVPANPEDREIPERLQGYDGLRAAAEFETYREVINVADEVNQVCVLSGMGGKQRLGQNLNLQVKLYSTNSAYALQRRLSTLDPGMPGYQTAQQQLTNAIQALGNPPPPANPNQASSSQAACTDESDCLEGWTCAVQDHVQWYFMYGTSYPSLHWCEQWLDAAWQAALNVMGEVTDKFNG